MIQLVCKLFIYLFWLEIDFGFWVLQYKSRYEGDLVGKCYFAKHKLVWEVLDGGLKNKIEIQWSDIVAIKANFPDDGPETLDVVVLLILLLPVSIFHSLLVMVVMID